MNERTWHSGPPPHVGWWNASAMTNDNVWRWWDGKQWSKIVFDTELPKAAGKKTLKKLPKDLQSTIEWTDYWPENARVPRIVINLPLKEIE